MSSPNFLVEKWKQFKNEFFGSSLKTTQTPHETKTASMAEHFNELVGRVDAPVDRGTEDVYRALPTSIENLENDLRNH